MGGLVGREPGYFVGSETGGHLHREHLHGLLFIPPDEGQRDLWGDVWPIREKYLRKRAWEWWFKHYGRALILPFDPGKGATHYVTKYVTKALSDWDIGGTLEYRNSSRDCVLDDKSGVPGVGLPILEKGHQVN